MFAILYALLMLLIFIAKPFFFMLIVAISFLSKVFKYFDM